MLREDKSFTLVYPIRIFLEPPYISFLFYSHSGDDIEIVLRMIAL